jgi:hypothetical protein
MIVLSRTTITDNLDWFGSGWGVRALLFADALTIEDSTISENETDFGRGGQCAGRPYSFSTN